ncbi:hypothetical protein FisN_2Hu023 [Fistulifera solaris]|uniref:Uncharacterized protein n=1 Tax=Fistulifera solaris TaxID=1519565 RepID=A0A1Z5KDV5_FISSO|nr:hypothetical protein FisN_2Hu023 [Fistulifera solaris]|eukprot:GAX24484.1 hypothetical protein FisN_2Hu023 [Fistulifera solaris]
MKKTIHALALLLINAFALQLLISHVRRREEFFLGNKNDQSSAKQIAANRHDATLLASFRGQSDSNVQRTLITRHKALLPTELLHDEDDNTISSRDGLVQLSEEDENNSNVGFFPKGFAIFSGIGRGDEIATEENEAEEEGLFSKETSDLDDGDQVSFDFLDSPVVVSEMEDEEITTIDTSQENGSIVDRPQAFLPIFGDDASEKQYLNLFQPDDKPDESTEDTDPFQPLYNLETDPDNAQDYSEIFLSVFGTRSPNVSPAPTVTPSGGASPGPSPEPSSQIVGTPMPTLRPGDSVAPTESLPLFTFAPSIGDAPTLRPVLDGQTSQPTLRNTAPTVRPAITPTLQPTLLDAPTVRPTVTTRPTESTPLFTLMPTTGTTTVPSSQTTTTPGVPTMAPTTSSAPAGNNSSVSLAPSIDGSVISASPTIISASNSSAAPTGSGTETLQPSIGNATQAASSSSPTLSVTSLDSAPPSAADNTTVLPTLPPTSTAAPSLSSPPSIAPSISPAPSSTFSPSILPSTAPSLAGSPSAAPSTTVAPSGSPIVPESLEPTGAPSITASSPPTVLPTNAPTAGPTAVPTAAPTTAPTLVPSPTPTASPTAAPTLIPTPQPTSSPVASVARRDAQLQQSPSSSSASRAVFSVFIIAWMTICLSLI